MRAFVAINLPPDVRQGIWSAAAPLRAASFPIRWVRPDGLHLTLKFLGWLDPEREPDVTRALAAAAQGARRFELPIAGFGAFPSPERPRVVWVGCEALPPLELLQHRLEQEMERLGFAVEGRPFRPHVTLGRVEREARAAGLRGLGEALDGLNYAAQVTVGSLDLMQSELRRDGARYTVRRRVELAA